jgi:hypothetical protein
MLLGSLMPATMPDMAAPDAPLLALAHEIS